MIDPARALSLCHPIATFFITLLLASPALRLRPRRRRRSPRCLLPPPSCAFLCSVAKQIANSFTEIFGLLITFFFAVVVVVVVVGLCGCSSCGLQQRLNSNKSLLHYSRWCVVICGGGGDSSRRGSEFVDFKRIFVVGGGVREEEEEDQRRQQRTTTVSSSKLQQLWRKFQ